MMNYPVIAKGSKVGIHTILPSHTAPWVRSMMERGIVFPLVKSVDNAALPLEIKKISPKTITMWRSTETPWDGVPGLEEPNPHISDIARNVMDKTFKYLEKME